MKTIRKYQIAKKLFGMNSKRKKHEKREILTQISIPFHWIQCSSKASISTNPITIRFNCIN